MSESFSNLTPITVSLENASVALAGQEVLDNVSLTIKEAGITVILGANGAGKSSLLSALAGLLPLRSGRRNVLEQNGRPAAITRIGYVLQKPVLLRRSIAGNINYAMASARIGWLRRPALRRHVLDVMNIKQSPKSSAFHLSQGERQRLVVARVLAMEPGILLLDEATNSLDFDTARLLEKHIRILAKKGLPVIWVTHNLDQVKRIADRIVEIKDGRISRDCKADEYFNA